MKGFNLLFVVAVIFSSCDETKKVIDVAGSVQLSGTYTITKLDATPIGEKAGITMTFAAIDKSIRGNTGCNSFFGNYNNVLYTLSFSDIAMTEMACPAGDIMQNEIKFTNALNNTGSYNLQDNVLTLYSKTDRSVLLTAKKETKEAQ